MDNKILELKKKIKKLDEEVGYYDALQQGLKLVLNGSYGALTTQYFILFNKDVAGTITAEGRELTKTMSKKNEDYWYKIWHKDTTLHKRMFIKDIQPISDDKSVSVYGDSVDKDTILKTDIGDYTIEELHNKYEKESIREDKSVIPVDFKSLNWTKDKGIYYAKVKNIIKHYTKKDKWKISAGGKTIYVTNDHSIIVFRDGDKIEIKPSEIRKTDKILIVELNDNFNIVEIDEVSKVGNFNEYVYDLEMEDESHTFIGNDILVHNTDSIFVGFDSALRSCDWKDRVFNDHWLNNCPKTYSIISSHKIKTDINNTNFKNFYSSIDIIDEDTKVDMDLDVDVILISGDLVKNDKIDACIKNFKGRVIYNWSAELDFMQGMDKFRIADYFKDELDKHAASYGVENIQDFELEKISESIINIEKKKYIQHITWEDGIGYDRFSYFQPKGVELIRSGTAVFARDKEMGIYRIVKYLFSHPDNFNVQELMAIIKEMRTEFELADINDISGQSSCSKYEEKVVDDKDSLEFVKGAHFGVKAAGHYNYLLNKNKDLQDKYEYLKSGDKIKYYYTTLDGDFEKFAFKRGEYPIEFAPPIDYDTQFEKVILSPINGIIKKLDMPIINKRLSILGDIFGGL